MKMLIHASASVVKGIRMSQNRKQLDDLPSEYFIPRL
ncbi:hypothetical protein SAMN06264849_10891 [Melghirimyces algeriensis]|uniref:Uncharacterized protein n=1 Tax=Melghirimyces algeriensis TaxID=910412 RepID=A0A521EAS1_9BACL|nr:hypothetical protein SAMN06264849_10891 [Melghirimyces algeriensis]